LPIASHPDLPSFPTRRSSDLRHVTVVFRGDSCHVGPMGGFLVARIAQHHAVIIEGVQVTFPSLVPGHWPHPYWRRSRPHLTAPRSEEHTSELQSRENLVCRLL